MLSIYDLLLVCEENKLNNDEKKSLVLSYLETLNLSELINFSLILGNEGAINFILNVGMDEGKLK